MVDAPDVVSRALREAPPDQLAEAADRAIRSTMGALRTDVLVADYRISGLWPVLDPDLPAAGFLACHTVAQRCFSSQLAVRDGEGPCRLYLPLTVWGERLGVLLIELPAVPNAAVTGRATDIAGALAVAMRAADRGVFVVSDGVWAAEPPGQEAYGQQCDDGRGHQVHRPADLAAAIAVAAETLTAVLDSVASRHQVPPTQLRVLTLISGRPETNVNGLAELLDVVPSSASRLCDRLEATGLLRRVADPRDRREVRLVPTAAALTLSGELADRRQRAVQAVLDRMQHDLLLALVSFARAATSPPEQQTDPAVQRA